MPSSALRWLCLLVWCAPVCLAAQTQAQDILYLKNGAIIKGIIQTQTTDDSKVIIDIGNDRLVTFSREEIQRMEKAETATTDWVILKNGSVFKGQIVQEWSSGLTLQLENGSRIQFSNLEIKEVQHDQPALAASAPRAQDYKYITYAERQRARQQYAFRERGWYNYTAFGLLNGVYDGLTRVGVGLHSVTGYQFNRWLGAGLGLGFDAFNIVEQEQTLSVFAEGRSYLLKKRNSPFVSLGAGYGFAFKNPSVDIVRAEGGLRFHPAIGLRLGAYKHMNMTMDLGYVFQSATFVQETTFFDPRTETKDITYRRLTLRIGALF